VGLPIDDEKKICGPGKAYYIPRVVPHRIKVLNQNLECIKIFTPPKNTL